MATKTPAKAPARPVESVQEYRMPKDVADWIDSASSRIAYLTSTVERLKEENAALRKANKAMEAKVMGTSQE